MFFASLISLFLYCFSSSQFLAPALASQFSFPVSEGAAPLEARGSPTVSPELFSRFQKYAQLVGASYCPDNAVPLSKDETAAASKAYPLSARSLDRHDETSKSTASQPAAQGDSAAKVSLGKRSGGVADAVKDAAKTSLAAVRWMACGVGIGCGFAEKSYRPSISWNIKNTKISDTTAFIAEVDNKYKEILFVIRGSVSEANWSTNLKFWKHETSEFCKDCKMHSGFMTAWAEMKPEVVKALNRITKKHKEHKVVVIGHSLGGAIATIAAFDLRRNADFGKKVELFAYASPRVANKPFAKWMTAQVAGGFPAYRITATKDPVPHVPFSSLGFAHFGPEYFLASNAAKPSISDMQVIKPEDSRSSGVESELSFKFKPHRNYFMKDISKCHGSNVDGISKGQFSSLLESLTTKNFDKSNKAKSKAGSGKAAQSKDEAAPAAGSKKAAGGKGVKSQSEKDEDEGDTEENEDESYTEEEDEDEYELDFEDK